MTGSHGCRALVTAAFAAALSLPTAAEASGTATSATVQGPQVLRVGDGAVGVPRGPHRVLVVRRGTRVQVEVDGRPRLRATNARGRPLRGTDVLRTDAGPVALLAHRLLALQARAPHGAVLGTDQRNATLPGRDWTVGFLAGGLWAAHALVPEPALARAAAKASDVAARYVRARIHDQGMIGDWGLVPGIDERCRPGQEPRCRQWRGAARQAADRVAALTDAGTGLIVTQERCLACPSGEQEAIVDSAMNVALLRRVGRDRRAPQLVSIASRHLRALTSTLQRPDGSTAQVARIRDGRVVSTTTRQGLAPDSTWSRGQAWFAAGLAAHFAETREPWSADAAAAALRFFAARLPPSGVPLYDLDAVSGPPDASATALAALAACDLSRGAAGTELGAWAAARARDWQGALLGQVSGSPAGRLGAMTYTAGGPRQDEFAELVFGTAALLRSLERCPGVSGPG